VCDWFQAYFKTNDVANAEPTRFGRRMVPTEYQDSRPPASDLLDELAGADSLGPAAGLF